MSTSTATIDPAAATQATPRGGLGPLLIAVLASTLLSFAVVGGAVYWLLKSGKLASAVPLDKKSAAVTSSIEEAADAKGPEALPASHVLALEPMVVNLSDADGRSYLRASISLRVADEAKPKAKEESKADKPDVGASAALRDTTLSVLGAQTAGVLLASGGLDALKKKLRQTYALENRDTHVLDVYVTDLLVQRG